MTAGSLLPDPPARAGQVFAAKVSRVDPFSVTLDNYGSTYEDRATWVAAGQVPARGDRVLAVIDDQAKVWAFPSQAGPAGSVDIDVRVVNSATLSLASGAAVTFNTVVHDASGCYSAGNPSRLTAPAAEKYTVGANVKIDGSATTFNRLLLRKTAAIGGATTVFARDTRTNTASNEIPIVGHIALAAGDWVEVIGEWDGGDSTSTIVLGAGWSPCFWMTT